MTLGVKGSATEWAQWTTSFDESRDGDGETRGPFATEAKVQGVVLFDRLHRDLNGPGLFIEGDRDIARDEVHLKLGLEAEVIGQMSRTTEPANHLADPFGERSELDLLALNNDQAATLTDLKEEQPSAHFTTHAHHHFVGAREDVVHEGLKSFSDPVLFTHSTTGVASVKQTALSEHGEITVR